MCSILYTCQQRCVADIADSTNLRRCPHTFVSIYLLNTHFKLELCISDWDTISFPLPVPGGSSAGVKVASARLPSPKTMVSSPTQILSQFPKQHPQSPKQLQQGSPMGAGAMGQVSNTPPRSTPLFQVKQESGEYRAEIPSPRA